MTRVLSAVAMLAIVVGTVWWLPSWATLGLAELVVLLALVEYVDLAERAGAPAPKGLVVVAGLAICAAAARDAAVVTVLMAATVAVGAAAVGKPRGRASGGWTYAAGVFGPLYVGLPLGTLVAIHAERGAETVLLLLAVIVASDAAQFYGGRALGRRPLAPATSPKKTIEGAFCGVLAGSAVMAVASGWGGLAVHPAFGAAFGAALAGIGIVGDLFESKLKREAGVKDVSGLIPGHGGVMDRLDSWLFAIPLFDAVFRGLSA